MEVTIVSKKLVKPTSPTPQKLRNLPISSHDQLVYPLYTRVILYYAANDEQGDADEAVSQRKRRLEESLARVLSLYYPLAGRYTSDKHMVDCNDQGAELLEAKVSCKLSQVLSGNVPAHELNSLVSSGYKSPATPLLIVQLNVFDCGGIAIGVTNTHRIVDGFTKSQFIRGWSIACSQGMDKVDRPSFELGSVFPARENTPLVYRVPRKKEQVKIVTNRFLLKEEAIRTLKDVASSAKADQCGSVGSRFSRGEVVTALIWMVLIRTSQAKNNGNLRPSALTQPANLRDKVKIPIPPTSCGNFVIFSNAKFVPTEGKRNVDFAELVLLLHDSVRSTINQCATFLRGDDLAIGVCDALNVIGNYCDEVDICRFTNSCSFPYYEADFGWGKPVWISSLNVPVDKFIILMGTNDGKGIEAWVSLDEDDMLLFQQNPEIMAFASISQVWFLCNSNGRPLSASVSWFLFCTLGF